MTDEDDDLATQALLEFLNSVEAGIVSARKRVGDQKGVTPHPDYGQAGWITLRGARGDYEQVSRNLVKEDLFDRLAAELEARDGFWQHQGYKYWFHMDDRTVIDRRCV
jgi:hypothetical protein